MFKTLTVLLLGGLLTIQSAWADDSAKLVGTWKLIAFETEFQDGSPPRPIFGKNPLGYANFSAEGRLIAVLEAEGRNGREDGRGTRRPAQVDGRLFGAIPGRGRQVDHKRGRGVESRMAWHRTGALLQARR